MSGEENKAVVGITCVAVTDASREAILAVHKAFEDFRKDGNFDVEQHQKATIAALKAAIVACGGD
ncbi:hypothetical protein [Enterobacter hormaechei]|uniref:hypothetical protein n=1 Tax=Enterobacter hormaechei TaxID=158836 RepID=UPI00079290AE|nr:hypothetical protein [Enterobacter hormaechei]CZW09927.1 Uncharacterised protein [Enterobacter hormaechei]CZW55837.1 Uncharacterised protein [Enterobacter hormaechei]SAG18026.1 Uncharacterised protein [Enterobacter hormaechei]